MVQTRRDERQLIETFNESLDHTPVDVLRLGQQTSTVNPWLRDTLCYTAPRLNHYIQTVNGTQQFLDLDARHVWHPYSASDSELPVYPVVSASGVRLKLADGRYLLGGIAT